MKANTIIIVLVTTVPFVGTALAVEQENARLSSSLGPRAQNVSVTQGDAGEKNFTHDDLFALQKQFLDNFISPKNDIQAKSINSSLLAEDVQGRVDITRTFDGRELNTEYLFGLFANLATSPSFSLLGIPVAYEITNFAASQNIAAASTRFTFNFQALNITLPIQIQTWNAFNAAGEISMYDANFGGWWAWAVDTLIGQAQQALSLSSGKNVTTAQTYAYVQSKLATSICTTAQEYCVGPALQQYDSATSCYNFLTNETRLGESYELGRNTVLCRMVHQNMVPLRPEVHCPHIGPTGGGYCVDYPSYAVTVGQTYFTNFPFAYGNSSLSG
ncbi:hypothetical protein BDR22DRAFT_259805 [Usnea florida]